MQVIEKKTLECDLQETQDWFRQERSNSVHIFNMRTTLRVVQGLMQTFITNCFIDYSKAFDLYSIKTTVGCHVISITLGIINCKFIPRTKSYCA